MTSRVYHGYQQDLSQLRSALPILPSTQRPDFQLIFKRLLSKSACLRGSAPDPAGALPRPQTPSWKRLVLTTLLKNRSRAASSASGVTDVASGRADTLSAVMWKTVRAETIVCTLCNKAPPTSQKRRRCGYVGNVDATSAHQWTSQCLAVDERQCCTALIYRSGCHDVIPQRKPRRNHRHRDVTAVEQRHYSNGVCHFCLRYVHGNRHI